MRRKLARPSADKGVMSETAFFAMVVFVALVGVVELIVGRKAPRLLARLAILSLGVERDVVLPRRPANATGGHYRDDAGTAAVEGMDDRWRPLEALPYGTLNGHGSRLRTMMFTRLSVLVVEGRVADGVLALRARMTMPGSLGLVAASVFMVGFVASMGLAVGLGFLVLVTVATAYNGLYYRRLARRDLAEPARAIVDGVAAGYARDVE